MNKVANFQSPVMNITTCHVHSSLTHCIKGLILTLQNSINFEVVLQSMPVYRLRI